jgi:hypothetical protein
MDNTIILQGNFVSNGTDVRLNLRSDVDWVYTYNYTQIAANADSTGYKFYWQRGMPQAGGLEYQSNAGGTAVNIITLSTGGFTLFDTSTNPVAAGGTISAIDGDGGAGGVPRVTVASTAGLVSGDVVLINNVAGAKELGGYYFEITVVDGTNFDLIGMPSIADGTTGTYKLIKWPPMFQPAVATISEVTTDTAPLGLSKFTTTAPHGYSVGQLVRFSIPAVFGMVQLDGLVGTVTAVATDLEFDTDIDITGFTAFTFPVSAKVPFSPAIAVPFGQFTGSPTGPSFNLGGAQVNGLQDSVTNTAEIGIILGGGTADSPAGVSDDLVYWVAGKSFSVDNIN